MDCNLLVLFAWTSIKSIYKHSTCVVSLISASGHRIIGCWMWTELQVQVTSRNGQKRWNLDELGCCQAERSSAVRKTTWSAKARARWVTASGCRPLQRSSGNKNHNNLPASSFRCLAIAQAQTSPKTMNIWVLSTSHFSEIRLCKLSSPLSCSFPSARFWRPWQTCALQLCWLMSPNITKTCQNQLITLLPVIFLPPPPQKKQKTHGTSDIPSRPQGPPSSTPAGAHQLGPAHAPGSPSRAVPRPRSAATRSSRSWAPWDPWGPGAAPRHRMRMQRLPWVPWGAWRCQGGSWWWLFGEGLEIRRAALPRKIIMNNKKKLGVKETKCPLVMWGSYEKASWF